MGTPARNRKRHARELAERQAWLAQQVSQGTADAPDAPAPSVLPDAGGESAAAAQAGSVAPVRKEP